MIKNIVAWLYSIALFPVLILGIIYGGIVFAFYFGKDVATGFLDEVI